MQWNTLNIFQRLTRQWDSLHPYNAAQLMRLAGTGDPDALAAHWRASLDELGLGRVRTVGDRFRWEPLNGQIQPALILRTAPQACLEQVLAQELNRPFNPDDDLPFRALLFQGNDSHWLGVVYHHWVADSFSIRQLLRQWFLRIYDPARTRRQPLNLHPPGYLRLFGPAAANWSLLGGILHGARWTARFKRVRRLDPDVYRQFHVRFRFYRAGGGLIQRLVPIARAAGVTVNDVFLAAMAQACDRFVPVKRTVRRQDLALGTIVDLRCRTTRDTSDLFGLFLGFTSVFCRPHDLPDFRRLLRCVSRQNARHKAARIPEASQIRMLAGLLAQRLLSRDSLIEMYRKRLALAGGISNVNLNRDWPADYHPHPLLEYLRVSPCGPLMPVVFTPTTLGGELNFGLTYRTPLIPDDHAHGIADTFLDRIQSFVECSAPPGSR
ncbi:condensation domain-containing protein [Fontivita pretiosa]|uniref:condensation domain-containing protein n=1 Tax=Fontivita pretiosa TaxID=2989684 RepID=UPI003D168403